MTLGDTLKSGGPVIAVGDGGGGVGGGVVVDAVFGDCLSVDPVSDL